MNPAFKINNDGAIPLKLEDLPQIEKALGAKLPEDYVKWASENAGGFLDPFGVYGDIEDGVGVSGLSPIYPTQHSAGLVKGYGYWSESESPELLPIAEGPTGDCVAIKIKSDDIGSIWYCRTEEVAPERAYRRIADNFTQFIEELKPADYKKILSH